MTDGSPRDHQVVRRLVGVYDADSSVIGELTYFVAARLGRAHCALCDITHGRVRAKPEWRAAHDRLPVAFDTFHRDDQPDTLRSCNLALPAVAAETDAGFVPLLGPVELEGCHGSVSALLEAVEHALRANAFDWPS